MDGVQAKVYKEQGGDEQVIADGGQQTVESGGTISVESGGAVKVDGVDVTDEMKALENLETELPKLEGLTAEAAELNRLDGVTPGTVTASKAVVVDAAGKVDTWDPTVLKKAGAAIDATAAELNTLIRYPGTMAKAVIDFNATGEAAMTITIDGVVYAEADIADAPNGVWTNGASAADSATSLAAAINGDTRAAVPFTAIVSVGGDSVILLWDAVGTAGNVVITTTSVANCTVENSTGGTAAGIKQMTILNYVVTAQDILAGEINIPMPFTPTKILVNYFDTDGAWIGGVTDKATIEDTPARVHILTFGATNLVATDVVQVMAVE